MTSFSLSPFVACFVLWFVLELSFWLVFSCALDDFFGFFTLQSNCSLARTLMDTDPNIVRCFTHFAQGKECVIVASFWHIRLQTSWVFLLSDLFVCSKVVLYHTITILYINLHLALNASSFAFAVVLRTFSFICISSSFVVFWNFVILGFVSLMVWFFLCLQGRDPLIPNCRFAEMGPYYICYSTHGDMPEKYIRQATPLAVSKSYALFVSSLFSFFFFLLCILCICLMLLLFVWLADLKGRLWICGF